MRRLSIPVIVALLLAVLTGCSSSADYSDADAAAAIKYAVAHSQGLMADPPPPADATRFLKIVHKYCEAVKDTSIAGMNEVFDPDARALMEGTAERYCPHIMNSATE